MQTTQAVWMVLMIMPVNVLRTGWDIFVMKVGIPYWMGPFCNEDRYLLLDGTSL